jgi:hypothetical protein
MLKAKLRSKTLCLLSAWMAVFHLAAQGFSPGAVLCLQADGQTAVEIPGASQSCAGQVASPRRAHAALPVALLVSDEDCGPCADLLLPDVSAAEGPAGRHFTTGHLSTLTWQHPAPILLEPVRTSGAALHRPPPNILPPAHLHRSTVLLI